MSRKPLQVWLLSDGRPGHYRQAEGVVRALRLGHSVDVHRLDVRLRLGLARYVTRRWLRERSTPLPTSFERLAYGKIIRPHIAPQLILSAGGNLLAMNVSLSRQLGAENVVIGSLRGFHSNAFSACLTLQPRKTDHSSSIVLDFTPTPYSRESARKAGALFLESERLDAQPYWTVLVGGDGAGYRYQKRDWEALANRLQTLVHSSGHQLLVLTSRRTPPLAIEHLRRLTPHQAIRLESYPSRAANPLTVEAALGLAYGVICTEDSMSMLNEALTLGLPVMAIRPLHAEREQRYDDFLIRQVQGNRLLRQSIDRPYSPDSFSQLTPITTDPAAHLYQELVTRLSCLSARHESVSC